MGHLYALLNIYEVYAGTLILTRKFWLVVHPLTARKAPFIFTGTGPFRNLPHLYYWNNVIISM